MSDAFAAEGPRWDPYVLTTEDYVDFWRQHLEQQPRKVLYIVGRGFDPRMTVGLASLLQTQVAFSLECLLVHYDEGPDSASVAFSDRVVANEKRLREIVGDRGIIRVKEVHLWTDQGLGRRRVGSREAASVFGTATQLVAYTDVVLDISAMPRSIYSSLIGKILFLLDNASGRPETTNFHLVICEDAGLDHEIREAGIDDSAAYLHGLTRDMESEASSELPTVWLPVLGEGQVEQVRRIHELVRAEEICPVLPMPSREPRRGDALVEEYRELLIDQWQVDPRNFVFAPERNPFAVYRQLHLAAKRYARAFHALGGCKIALSSHSSKLVSVGPILAAYELARQNLTVGLAHVESQGYEIPSDYPAELSLESWSQRLVGLWLFGECYATH